MTCTKLYLNVRPWRATKTRKNVLPWRAVIIWNNVILWRATDVHVLRRWREIIGHKPKVRLGLGVKVIRGFRGQKPTFFFKFFFFHNLRLLIYLLCTYDISQKLFHYWENWAQSENQEKQGKTRKFFNSIFGDKFILKYIIFILYYYRKSFFASEKKKKSIFYQIIIEITVVKVWTGKNIQIRIFDICDFDKKKKIGDKLKLIIHIRVKYK